MIHFLTLSEVLMILENQIRNYGGIYGVRDLNLFIKFGNKYAAIKFWWRIFIQNNSRNGGTSHNVPAVYDGLAVRIRKCVAFPGPTNYAGATAWEWSVAE
jgi:hypothetical protein